MPSLRPLPARSTPRRRGTFSRGRILGFWGEFLARRHLERRGLAFLGRNLRLGRDELDLLFQQGQTLVLVEVKSTTEASFCRSTEKIDADKTRALRRLARAWLVRERLAAARADAVVVRFRRRLGFLPWPEELSWFPDEVDLEL